MHPAIYEAGEFQPFFAPGDAGQQAQPLPPEKVRALLVTTDSEHSADAL